MTNSSGLRPHQPYSLYSSRKVINFRTTMCFRSSTAGGTGGINLREGRPCREEQLGLHTRQAVRARGEREKATKLGQEWGREPIVKRSARCPMYFAGGGVQLTTYSTRMPAITDVFSFGARCNLCRRTFFASRYREQSCFEQLPRNGR